MNTIKKFLINIAKKNTVFRKLARTLLNFIRLIVYKINSFGTKVDDKLIVFATFSGKSYACSPKAIYQAMLNNEKYKDYTFVWGFNNIENYNELQKNKNTVVVKFMSKEYQKYLAKAKYWIFNYRALDHIYPKKNQIFIQCWHGTPLKRLGYDLKSSDNVMNSIEEIRDKYRIDAKKFKYFISPSKFASEKFISAWNLKEVKKENVIVEKGYPRNDFLYNYTDEDVTKIKQKLGLENEKRKIILYAPTWRDNQHTSNLGYTYKTEVDFEKMQKELGDNYIILFRAHYLVANSFEFDKYSNFIYDVSKVDDINELYVISDILITDYSSVFFDYANLKKPIVFYMYDLENYRDDIRGFYFDISELPGNIVKTEDELIKEVEYIAEKFEYNEKYKDFNNKYNYLDDGNAAKRVIEECIK